MPDILISFIVPVYNAEKYLEQCLQSIISQTYKVWECILIDDGSIDNSGAICDGFVAKDSRFRVFHKENGGVSAARNLGIKQAKGEWVTFIDADDFVGETYLHGLLQPVLQGNEVDFVHGGCTNFENGQITSVNQEYEFFVGDDKGKIFSLFRGLVVSKLFKTEILRNNDLLFDEGMKIAEDMAFTMDYLFYVNAYALVPEKSYYYRRDNVNSATHRNIWPLYQHARKDFEHLYKGTVNYINDNQIGRNDSQSRYEQRANQYFQVIRSMYHDCGISKKMRMQILRSDSETGLIDLLHFINPDQNCYKTSRLLLEKKFSRFDTLQSFKECIVKLKEFIKTVSR